MKALRIAIVAALALAVLTPTAAWTLDRFYGKTVQPVVKNAPEVVKLNKMLYEKGSPVADIYGVPTNRKMRVLFVSRDKLLQPSENRSLHLLLIDKQKGENPLQVKTVWFLAWRLLAGLLLAALLGVLLHLLLSRRARRKQSATRPSALDPDHEIRSSPASS